MSAVHGFDHPCPRTQLPTRRCDCGARHMRIRQTRNGGWNAEEISGRVELMRWTAFSGGDTAEGARQQCRDDFARRGVVDVLFVVELPHATVLA